jgi:hypothetical protein
MSEEANKEAKFEWKPIIPWPFGIVPRIINLILSRPLVQTIFKASAISLNQPMFSNVEVIEWTDWRGRVRKTTIHREVK